MIQWFDFEQGAPPKSKSKLVAIMPIQGLQGKDPSDYAHTMLMMANGKVLRFVTEKEPVIGIKYGTRVLVVFSEAQQTELLKSGWGDPGPGMIGVLEMVIPLAVKEDDEDVDPF